MEHLRTQLAAATRMLVEAGILGYSGHVSARVGEHLLIQPVSDPRGGLRPERLLLVDLDGAVVDGDGRPPSEVHIHTGVYRARPDVGAVAHFHHDPTTTFSLLADRPLVPVKNHASRWGAGVPVHEDPSHLSSPEQGAALAATLGAGNAALLRGHGEVVVAEDVPSLFADVIHFVENADALARAIPLGTVVPLSTGDCQRFLATFDRPHHTRKLWRFHASVAAERGILPAEWAALPARVAAEAGA